MKDRPTVEVVILLFAVTVCAFLLLAGFALTVAAVLHPGDPLLDKYIGALSSVVTAIVGALLGLMAGRKAGGDTEVPARPAKASQPSQ